MSEPLGNPITDHQAWLCGSMAAASFVGVSQLATRSDLNLYHELAIGLFALCLPIFVVVLINWKLRFVAPKAHAERLLNVVGIAIMLFFSAVVCLFVSFGGIYGAAIVASSIVAICIGWARTQPAKKLPEPPVVPLSSGNAAPNANRTDAL